MIALALAGQAAAADRAPIESWGKPGVGYEQYRSDSIECAKLGYYRDVSGDEPAKRFIRGFRTATDQLNGANGEPNVQRWINSVQQVRPDRQTRDLQAIQVRDVERCLTDKGYRRFTLSTGEAKALDAYPRGSEARHRYLHVLGAR